MPAKTGAGRKFDRYPQAFRMLVSQPSAHTFTEAMFVTNVQEGLKRGSIQAMEILWVEWFLPAGKMANGSWIWASITDRSRVLPGSISDIGTVDMVENESYVETATGAHNRDLHITHQKQAADGYGVLYTKKNIYIQIQSSEQDAGETVKCAIYHRMVELVAGELVYDTE